MKKIIAILLIILLILTSVGIMYFAVDKILKIEHFSTVTKEFCHIQSAYCIIAFPTGKKCFEAKEVCEIKEIEFKVTKDWVKENCEIWNSNCVSCIKYNCSFNNGTYYVRIE